MSIKLPLQSREIIQRLQRLGFVFKRQRGSHVVLKHPVTGRRVTVPEHNSDLPKGTVKGILRQANILVDEFLRD
ncbi:MAG TPA: type II toxin-antitoxin system HicA family toxin [Candidatus Methylomirabilis sp.]|nr:type II toxin-antitoxin system HicA family toxin [Candidatus Methylomirabilis sp.]